MAGDVAVVEVVDELNWKNWMKKLDAKMYAKLDAKMDAKMDAD
jgi:hypothetical protein